MVLGIAVCAVLLVSLSLKYGSFNVARASLQGKSIYCSNPIVTKDKVPHGGNVEVVFKLQNLTSREIIVHGSANSCSCTTAVDLPMKILPGTISDFKVNVDTEDFETMAQMTENIELYYSPKVNPVNLTLTLKFVTDDNNGS